MLIEFLLLSSQEKLKLRIHAHGIVHTEIKRITSDDSFLCLLFFGQGVLLHECKRYVLGRMRSCKIKQINDENNYLQKLVISWSFKKSQKKLKDIISHLPVRIGLDFHANNPQNFFTMGASYYYTIVAIFLIFHLLEDIYYTCENYKRCWKT